MFGAAPACSQDPGWVADWERAHRGRPERIESEGRIAPAGEPGDPLVVHGRVFRSDGATPAPGIVVFAYQTDAGGVYNARGVRGWRLHGWARTGEDGRFELRTIRPGSYPNGSTPAHIHFTIEGPRVARRWTPELRFADDPYVRDSEKRASTAAGTFGSVREVAVRDGVQHVEFNIRIADDGTF